MKGHPAGNRLHAEPGEEIRGDPLARNGLRGAVAACHDHPADEGHESTHDLQRVASLAPVDHVERRHTASHGRRGPFPHHHETTGLRKRQRAEQRRVHQREDRAVATDAERERDGGNAT